MDKPLVSLPPLPQPPAPKRMSPPSQATKSIGSVSQWLRPGATTSISHARGVNPEHEPISPLRIRPASKKEKNEPKKILSKFALPVGTGTAYKEKMRGGTAKTLAKMVRRGRTTFANISPFDRRYIIGLIREHAKRLPTGSSWSYSIKKDMKMDVEQERQGGKISLEDAKDFKKIIDQLD